MVGKAVSAGIHAACDNLEEAIFVRLCQVRKSTRSRGWYKELYKVHEQSRSTSIKLVGLSLLNQESKTVAQAITRQVKLAGRDKALIILVYLRGPCYNA